jgi:sulfatase maturation enzyme AslB (radical SAM superfamily)
MKKSTPVIVITTIIATLIVLIALNFSYNYMQTHKYDSDQLPNEESVCGSSRRHRSNQKSVIFTKTAFEQSYQQSPGYKHFSFSQDMDGITTTLPIDLHLDLGNHCNLACKMCWSGASTRIAAQMVKWGVEEDRQYLGVDWTSDPEVWNRFLSELDAFPNLKNIHLMGGETLLSPRFEQLVDHMIAKERWEVSFSFVTNGTVYKPDLIAKLSKFTRVGIEISIETTTKHNDYVRQGSKVEDVLDNIQKYQKLCNRTNISLTVRSAISALTIGYYYTLLEYCLDNNLLIKSLLVTNPAYLDCRGLPADVKQGYKEPYKLLLDKLTDVETDCDYNESDENNIRKLVRQQVLQVLNLLDAGSIGVSTTTAVEWMRKWDSEFGFDARELYPEFKELLDYCGY